jgi:uncharacterized membrane protein
MNTSLFLVSLLIAIVGPLLAISYLKPILIKVLQSLCNAEGGAYNHRRLHFCFWTDG